ncbi:hypothetical protein [Bacillus wiedmannii]|uniref:hypothetical protein n=1 Tax=Bacillus wiedmannii TaxID=1890302 RepID=UPI0025A08289|nr:hypothetical protein [Bacillus wiedmannii]MDM5270458.1 hypothetical protein [Bacillus wiedmannii]
MITNHRMKNDVIRHISKLLKQGKDENSLRIRVEGMGASKEEALFILEEAKKLKLENY